MIQDTQLPQRHYHSQYLISGNTCILTAVYPIRDHIA